MKRFILLVVIVFIVSCSGISSPEEIAEAEIREVLENVESAFNLYRDINKIMENYHPDFLHNGDDFTSETLIWEMRLPDYQMIDFKNVEVDLEGDEATVSFDLYLDEQVFEEPETFGDMSYFFRENNVWKIYGNQSSRE